MQSPSELSSHSDYPDSLGGGACTAINDTHSVDNKHSVGRQASSKYGLTRFHRYDSRNVTSRRAAKALEYIAQPNSRKLI